jgi:lysozyme
VKVNCVTSGVTVELTQNQFDALVSFAYNTGCGSLAKVAQILNTGDFAGATSKMKEYTKSGGVVLPGLVKRRAIEVNLFTS